MTALSSSGPAAPATAETVSSSAATSRLFTLTAAIVAVDLLEDALGRWQPLLGVLGGLPLVLALAAQRVRHGAITLVTAVLVDLVAGLTGEGHAQRPGRNVSLRVLDPNLELDHLRIDPGEPLRRLHRVAVPHAASRGGDAIGEVGGLDDERVALEVAPRITHQLTEAAADVRPPVERDDTRLVHHLVGDDDRIRRLDDARAVAVHHGKP